MGYTGDMRSAASVLKWTANNPVRAMIFVLATGLFLYFLYFVSPFFVPMQGSALSVGVADASMGRLAFGFTFLFSTIPGVLSIKIKSNRWLRWSVNLLFMDFFFLALLRIIIFGWLPVLWLPNALLSVCCVIMSLHIRVACR